MSDKDPSPWVCALRVDYTDGTHNTRIIHRGPEAECERLARIVPASAVELDPARVMQLGITGNPPPEEIRVNGLPAAKTARSAIVVVCRESHLET